jgi:hypothetical protein
MIYSFNKNTEEELEMILIIEIIFALVANLILVIQRCLHISNKSIMEEYTLFFNLGTWANNKT